LSFSQILPAFAYEIEESNDCMEGINAYQRKEYNTTIVIINKWLKDYPDSLNRDVAIYWLSRSYLMIGNKSEAASYKALLIKEFPNSPLIKLNEDELPKPAGSNEKGKNSQ
jgi:TolA-binding protein